MTSRSSRGGRQRRRPSGSAPARPERRGGRPQSASRASICAAMPTRSTNDSSFRRNDSRSWPWTRAQPPRAPSPARTIATRRARVRARRAKTAASRNRSRASRAVAWSRRVLMSSPQSRPPWAFVLNHRVVRNVRARRDGVAVAAAQQLRERVGELSERTPTARDRCGARNARPARSGPRRRLAAAARRAGRGRRRRPRPRPRAPRAPTRRSRRTAGRSPAAAGSRGRRRAGAARRPASPSRARSSRGTPRPGGPCPAPRPRTWTRTSRA